MFSMLVSIRTLMNISYNIVFIYIRTYMYSFSGKLPGNLISFDAQVLGFSPIVSILLMLGWTGSF